MAPFLYQDKKVQTIEFGKLDKFKNVALDIEWSIQETNEKKKEDSIKASMVNGKFTDD